MRREQDPDPAWVASLANVSVDRAEGSIAEARREEALFRYIARRHREGGRPGYIEIDAPLELYALTRLLRPRHVVEVGVSSGVSSAYLLAALVRNGRGTLHSVDLPSWAAVPPHAPARHRASWSLPPGRTSGWAVPSRLRGRWDLRLGDKADLLPALAQEIPGVELFVYDVPHTDPSAYREFLDLDRCFAVGSVAIADHGPSAGLCDALRRWSRRRHARPVRRVGLGLFGFRSRRRAKERRSGGDRSTRDARASPRSPARIRPRRSVSLPPRADP